MKKNSKPQVGIIMGSDSDLPVMRKAARCLKEFGVPHEMTIVSAHRTPDRLVSYGKSAAGRGIQVIIAGAGGAAHLPGMTASLSPLPVIGIPIKTKSMSGLDSLLSIAQMPEGIPVATVAVNNARNAALLAVEILGIHQPPLRAKLIQFKSKMSALTKRKARRLERRS